MRNTLHVFNADTRQCKYCKCHLFDVLKGLAPIFCEQNFARVRTPADTWLLGYGL